MDCAICVTVHPEAPAAPPEPIHPVLMGEVETPIRPTSEEDRARRLREEWNAEPFVGEP